LPLTSNLNRLMSLFLCYYKEVECYTPISLAIKELQNGFLFPQPPIFSMFLVLGFGFSSLYPLYIQGFSTIIYIYIVICYITLHYTTTISLNYSMIHYYQYNLLYIYMTLCHDIMSLCYTLQYYSINKYIHTFIQTKYDIIWIIYM
jgi:hypothetical protein